MTEVGLLDRAIATVAPLYAWRRVRARAALTAYQAGRPSRLGKRWDAPLTGPNPEIGRALATLRARSREVIRDNPYAARALSILVAHQVGYGFTPRVADKRALDLWHEWTVRCDASGMQNLDGLAQLVARSRSEAGEAFIRLTRLNADDAKKRGLKIPLLLDVIEPDYFPETKNSPPGDSGAKIVQAVEFGANGLRAAYHMHRQHPGEALSYTRLNEDLIRVPADEILHVYRILRPGQVRGVPDAAPVLLRLRQFEDLENAALQQEIKQAQFGVFFETDAEFAFPGTREGDPSSGMPERIDLAPGMTMQLPPGIKPTFLQPTGDGGFASQAFHRLASIAAGLGVTYDQLTGDMREANYSSLRASKLEFFRMIAQDHWTLFIPRFCQPVWTAFVAAAIRAGELPGRIEDYEAEWGPPSREMVDPGREVQGMIAAVRAGLTTLPQAVSEMGWDWQTHIEEIAAANKKLDEVGVILDSDPRRVSRVGGAQDASQNAAVEIAATGAARSRSSGGGDD